MPKDRNGVELTPGDIITYSGTKEEIYIFLKEADDIVHYTAFGSKFRGWTYSSVAARYFDGARIEVVGKMPDLWNILKDYNEST